MLRYYCDSQIFRYLKDTSKSFNKDLFDCIEEIKDDVIFTFSDAHLDDLSVSNDDILRDEDLLLMEKYVKENFFSRDYIYENTTFYIATPKEAYDSKDFSTSTKNPFEILKEELGKDNLIGSLINNFIDSVLNLEIPLNISQDQQSTDFYKFLDLREDNYRIKDILGNILKKLSDKKEFVKLRKLFNQYLNNENYSFENFDMNFNELMKNSVLGKSFFELSNNQIAENKRDNYFELFKTYFVNLEIFGVTNEKTKKGYKQFTFNNLSTDALHAYFASYNDYFITNDKGLQIKASILYKYFNIPTRIFTPKDFIAHKLKIKTNIENNSEIFYKTLNHSLETSFQRFSKFSFKTNRQVTTFSTIHHFFNYTKELQTLIGDKEKIIALYCNRPSHSNFIMFVELDLIFKKIVNTFGTDDELKGDLSIKEFNDCEIGSKLREWSFNNHKVVLSTTNNFGGSNVIIAIYLK